MSSANLMSLDYRLEKEKLYWMDNLSGDLIVSGIPLDYNRPAAFTKRNDSVTIELGADVSAQLLKVCANNESLAFAALVAALEICLHKYTGLEDIVIGTTIHEQHTETVSLNKVLALRNQVSDSLTVRRLLEDVKSTLSQAYANQKYPFSRVLELLDVNCPANREPLFNISALLENINNKENLAHLKNDATFIFSIKDGEALGRIEYASNLFKRATMEIFGEHYSQMLRAALSSPESQISALELLTPKSKQRLVLDLNNTECEYPRDKTIYQLFEQQVEMTPAEIAVVCEGRVLTYEELNRRANQLAHYLRGIGAKPGERIAILLEHSEWTIVAIMGALKAGACYVPLDPGHPKARLAFMIKDAQAKAVLTQQRLVENVQNVRAQLVLIDTDREVIDKESTHNPIDWVGSGGPAYVIYTSGSTGEPKGVKIRHSSLTNYIWWSKQVYLQQEAIDFPLYSSLAFDLTVTSIFAPLVTGNKIIVYPKAEKKSPLGKVMEDNQVGALKLTPSHLSLIAERDNRKSRIKRLIVGGEAFETELAQRVHNSFGGRVEIYNEYGPTEATVGCMIYKFDASKDDRAFVPIGRPAANVQVYILDEHMRPTAENVIGELYISGVGLAELYLGRDELTAQKFLDNPFLAGQKMYKTGDLVRWLPEGQMEFIGRRDGQRKFHGHRIELNEIRKALNRHPEVRDSAIVVIRDNNDNDMMMAYYVARNEIDAAKLRAYLSEAIIEETIPNLFVHLHKMPLTLNGKVNYNALPTVEQVRGKIKRCFVAPRTPIEEIVAGIWREILRVERIGVHDNFFELGGHSLLATQVVSRVREALGVEAPLRSLFECGTVSSLSGMIEQALNEETGLRPAAVTPVVRGISAPLSFAQQRLWFLDQLEPGNAAYNIPVALRIKGLLEMGALTRSFDEIVRRHESLRTSFSFSDGQPVQVRAAELSLHVPLIDLASHPEREGEALRLALDEARQPFDLAQLPLVRVRVIRLSEDEHMLLLTMHHIISDGWSMGVLIREVAALYEAFAQGLGSPLADLPIQYADYATWQRGNLYGATLERQLEYWRERLFTAPAQLDLPTELRRPTAQNHRGEVRRFKLGRELTEGLKSLSRREGVTLFMTLLAAFKALLARYCGQEDIVVGTPIANRGRVEIEPLIGFFVNTLALRTDLSGDPSFKELLGRVRETALEAYAHQDMPFERLVEELQPERDLQHMPLVHVMFIFQNTPVEVLRLPDLSFEPLDVYSGSAKVDLALNIQETADGLSAAIEYSAELFESATILRMQGHFENLLRETAINPERRMSELEVIGEAERRRLLEGGGDVGAYREFARLHQMFEEQVERNPDAFAISFQNERLSYRQLNARSNQLAHGLRELKIEPGRPIGVMLGSGPSQIVALMGALKAGAYFVCLDPEHPAPRLQGMLEEVAPACLITEAAYLLQRADLLRRLRQESDCKLLLMDESPEAIEESLPDRDWLDGQGTTNPNVPVGPRDTVYVVYTSGSSGLPKGIIQSQNSFSQFVEWMGRQFRIGGEKRVAQWASITYDASYSEIFSALCHGATLCMATTQVRSDPEAMADWLDVEAISLFVTVPSFCSQIYNVIEERSRLKRFHPLPALEFMLLAGEALPPRLAQAWLERYPRQPRLFNLYGPTESVLATFYEVERIDDQQRLIPIGRAIDGRQILILDSGRKLCPIGVIGEIYIRSSYLTNGYFQNPEETHKRFLQNPLHDDYPDEVYRTGDLARWLPDGNIEFFGRVDNQMKIRGIRIEPEEIEAALLRHESVSECAVVAHEYEDGDRRLVGHIVGSDDLMAAALREFAEEFLPGYMLPTTFVFLDRLPRTRNGKIERGALLKPEASVGDASREYVAPRTSIEAGVAEIWREILRIDQIGVNDDFFRLGGHSLLAARVINRLRGLYAVEIPLRDFIGAPTLASLSRKVEAARQLDCALAEHSAALLEKVKSLSDEEVEDLLYRQ